MEGSRAERQYVIMEVDHEERKDLQAAKNNNGDSWDHHVELAWETSDKRLW